LVCNYQNGALSRYWIVRSKYPELNARITPAEVLDMQDLHEETMLKAFVAKSEAAADPAHRLLLAAAWKNGMLGKLHHIVAGINGTELKDTIALVFTQFGRHLKDPANEPIIDKHVLRAYRASLNS